MTVLTNNDAALPLHRAQPVALIGRHAIETIDMGGGSAQVNPPYQVSIAEGLTGLLGEAVTVVDGVEVRTRPVPARPWFVTDPDTGQPGVHLTLFAADGSVIPETSGAAATAVVGFDDDFDRPVHRVTFRARVHPAGPVEVDALGAGSWSLTAGDQAHHFALAVSGTGFGEEILVPPARTHRVQLHQHDIVEATVTLAAGPGDQDDVPLGGARS